jgi:hypothetical protein
MPKKSFRKNSGALVARWIDIKTSSARCGVGSLDIDSAHLPKHLAERKVCTNNYAFLWSYIRTGLI